MGVPTIRMGHPLEGGVRDVTLVVVEDDQVNDYLRIAGGFLKGY